MPSTVPLPDTGYVPLPMGLLFHDSAVTLDPGAKILWVALYHHQHHVAGGGSFAMSTKEMLHLVQASPPTMRKWREQLVDAGWLSEMVLQGHGVANMYEVLVPSSDVAQNAMT